MIDWPGMAAVAVTGAVLVTCLSVGLGLLVVGWWIAEMVHKLANMAEGE